MSLYTIVLRLHGSGAVGIFVCLAIWLSSLAALRRARQVEQVRTLAWLIIIASPHMVLSVHFIPERTRKADRFLRTAIWTRQW